MTVEQEVCRGVEALQLDVIVDGPSSEGKKFNEKKLKKVVKEGGKRGVEIEGAADMGGLKFFCTVVAEPEADLDLLLETMKAMNAKSNPADEERKGGAGKIGKIIISSTETKIAMVAYVPKDLSEQCNAKEWLNYTVETSIGNKEAFATCAKIEECEGVDSANYATCVIENNPEKNVFALKLRDAMISIAYNFLKVFNVESRLRVALYGFGNQNKEMAKMLVEREDVEIVAVISNKSNVGRRFVDVIGLESEDSEVVVTAGSEAAGTLAETKPHVAMLSTLSTVGDIEPQLRICAGNQVNVVTIAEELLYSWTSAPEKTREMHELFQQHNVSLIGSGFIDGACCDMTRTMAGMMHKIEKLEGGLQYNVDHYGKVLAIAHGVGLTEEEFYAPETGPGLTSASSYPKSYVYNSNEWFAAALGLTVLKTEEIKTPTKAAIDLFSEAIDRTIPAGQCTGMTVTATTTTVEGVTIVGNQCGKCYEAGDEDYCAWSLEGNPAHMKFSMTAPPTPAMTNTAAISRVFQAVEAPAGYITTDTLPTMAAYKHSRVVAAAEKATEKTADKSSVLGSVAATTLPSGGA